jgi:hypothetical protein
MPKLSSVAAWLNLNKNQYLLRRQPIIVYSMRRTGSVAVHKSLEKDNQYTFAAHSFDTINRPASLLSGVGRWGARHIFAKQQPCKIISLVRNPVDNIISIFSRKSLGTRLQVTLETIQPGEEVTPEKLAVEFEQIHLGKHRHHQETNWFDDEYKAVLGVDVYEYPFDHEQGFCRITKGPYDALILRTEVPDDKKEKLIAGFIGSPTFKLISSSEATEGSAGNAVGKPGEKSPYAHLYKALKNDLRIPRGEWEALSNSRYMQHFCSPAEIAATAARYAKAD